MAQRHGQALVAGTRATAHQVTASSRSRALSLAEVARLGCPRRRPEQSRRCRCRTAGRHENPVLVSGSCVLASWHGRMGPLGPWVSRSQHCGCPLVRAREADRSTVLRAVAVLPATPTRREEKGGALDGPGPGPSGTGRSQAEATGSVAVDHHRRRRRITGEILGWDG